MADSDTHPVGLAARLMILASSESYLVLLVAGAAALMLLGIGVFVTPDTWLALVSGRVVAEGGPPSTDSLTAWTLGREWIDQQWLGQLALYEVWRAGGLRLVGVVHAVIVIGTLVFALAIARRRGASSPHVALIGVLAVLPIGIVAGNIRTQTFALPLFVVLLWLLSEDSRSPSARVYWSLPLLVLWANVHGSVIVGAGLVGFAGATAVGRGLRGQRSRGRVAHGAGMLTMLPAALLATPYGTALFTYLQDTFGNPEIARLAPEWMPTTFEAIHVPFYLLAALAVALVARERRQLTSFEQLTLALLLVGAFVAERNLAWFALAAVMLLAPLLTRQRPRGRDESPPVWLVLAVTAVLMLGVLVAAVRGLSSVDRQVESHFPSAAAAVVADIAARDASLKLFTHPRYADWLIFRHPPLAGRIPFDIRYDLLTPAELRRFRRFREQIGADWRNAMGGARLVVTDSSERPLDVLPPTSAVLLREPGARLLYAGHDVAVILRSTSAQVAP